MKKKSEISQQNLVSVVLPVFNAEKTLRRTLESVLTQTFKNWELIIVDDCSTDSSAEILQDLKSDSRVKLILLNENSGVSNARNVGLESSSGEFIAFIDSDDIWVPTKLEAQVTLAMDNPRTIVHSFYNLIDRYDKILKVRKAPLAGDYKDLCFGNYIGMSTALVKKSDIRDSKFFNIGHEDYAFWLNVCRRFDLKTLCVPEPLVFYSVGHSSLSSNKFKAAKWTWSIYRDQEGFSFFKALFFFSAYVFRSIFIRL
ncbi:MAG TPA: glycosyl transferase [Balneola sp.]|nr:glycosyl transferase [Balneola sp.]